MTRQTYEPVLLDVLDRMEDDSPSDRGTQTVAWYAHRDAEALDDPSLVTAAAELLRHERTKDRRRTLYFILGCLGKTTGEKSVEMLLNESLDRETDHHNVSAILDALKKMPSIEDASRIHRLVESPKLQVRHAAIGALARSKSVETERVLLGVLERSDNRFDLSYALGSLGKMGGREAIPSIARFIHHRTEDVKGSAIYALTALGDVREQNLFLDALTDRSSYAKAAALSALRRHGDSTAVSMVAKRVRELLRKPRRVELIPSDLVDGLEFLLAHEDASDAVAAIDAVRRTYAGRVSRTEATWIERNLLSAANAPS
jgi:HEAT repeat protein